MNSKLVAIVVALVVIGGSALLIYRVNVDDSVVDSDKLGEWYTVYEEIGRFDTSTGPRIVSKEFQNMEKHPFILEKIEKNTFLGTLDGIEVIGGLMGDTICFELIDQKMGYYCHAEGTFSDMTLSLGLIFHKDASFNEVTGGMYMFYIHEDSKGISTKPTPLNIENLTVNEGKGDYYIIGKNGGLTSGTYVPKFKVVEQLSYVSIVETIQKGVTIDNICIFKSNHKGVVSHLLGGCLNNQGTSMVYFGGVIIADGKLDLHMNCRFTGDVPSLMYSHASFNVGYYDGRLPTQSDISGKWEATIYDFDGETSYLSKKSIIKNIESIGTAFSSVETITEEGKTTSYIWLGSNIGNNIFLISEHDGRYFPLFGHVSGDKIHLCGYMISHTEYIGLNVELTRSD